MANSGLVADSIHVGTVDATGSPVFYWIAPEQCVIEAIYMVNTTGHVAHASNNNVFTVTNLGQAGAGTAVVAAQTNDSDVTGYAAITALVPYSITVAAAYAEMVANDVIKIVVTEGAAAQDLAAASFQIRYRRGCGVYYT